MSDGDDKIVVVREGGGGGMAVALVLGIIALLVVLYLLFGRDLIEGRTPTVFKADIDISAPNSGGGGSAPTK